MTRDQTVPEHRSPLQRSTHWLRLRAYGYFQSLSFVGLAVAMLFFAISVSPSLLPRTSVVQGLLSGFTFSVGYGIGVAGIWIWRFLELRNVSEKTATRLKWIVMLVGLPLMLGFLWRMNFWQNSIRSRMEMPAVDFGYSLLTALVAFMAALALLLIGRLLLGSCLYISNRLQRYLPPRLANVIGFLTIGFLAMTLLNDVILASLLKAADHAFAKLDMLSDEATAAPMDPSVTGSADSLVAWETIGRQGKEFILTGPSKEGIGEFLKQESRQPIRVYVGYRSGSDAQERAQLAVNELIRTGGFDRKVLIVATPTGTGWLDSNAVDSLEYLHAGDTAIVSTQYSYLPSWITILIDPDRSRESAQALFNEVYAHWTKLPKDSRPRLYLYGLSLGALGGEDSTDLYTIFNDPIQGAVFSGTPFPSDRWQDLVRTRNPESPSWLPTYRDRTMVRFMNQSAEFDEQDRWSSIRTVYIQYPSDPMIWFSPKLAFQRPDWLEEPRGYDVSPHLEWYPIITFLQVAFDLPMATSTPLGYGHNYSAASYIDAWTAVTAPDNWSIADSERLKRLFNDATEEP